jgi:adenosylcobinamide-phosphate synthase
MNDNRERPLTLILVVALLLDLTLGDPPNRFHPVTWMGHAVAAA